MAGGYLFLEHPKFTICQDTLFRHNLPSRMTSEVDEGGLDLFQEPADFYEPEKEATFASHELLSGKKLEVRLVGHNPLWVRPHCQPSWIEA